MGAFIGLSSVPPFDRKSDISYLIVPLGNVLETSSLHGRLLKVLVKNAERPAHLPATLLEELAPLAQRTSLRNGVIVTHDGGRDFETLEVTTWLESRVGLLEQLWPIRDTSDEETDVDVVEGTRSKSPLASAILDLAILVLVGMR